MKKVIELLEEADKYVFSISVHGDARKNVESRDMANGLIQEAIVLLKTPRWETPEQWEKRTGEKLDANAAVYFRPDLLYTYSFGISDKVEWNACLWKNAVPKCQTCVVATEAGIPPDDWRPEEAMKVKFENDIAIQKAMRRFSSVDLAKVILHALETKDGFKRNMMEASRRLIQGFLDDLEFCETPEATFKRFVKQYRKYAREKEEK
jgi:hypothetical protein